MPISQITHGGGEADRQVGRHGAEPRPPARAHQPDRQAMLQEEQVGRAEAEHDQRMAIEAIAQPLPERARPVFLDRQRVDVADAAAVEIAAVGVVHGVGAAPPVVAA